MSLFGECPTWLDEQAWSAYVEWRASLPKKQRMTSFARTLILTELSKLKEAGQDPTACLLQSLRNCWLDVYAIKRPKEFSAIPANDPKPAPQVATTAAYLAQLDQHRAAAQSDQAKEARAKLAELRNRMRVA